MKIQIFITLLFLWLTSCGYQRESEQKAYSLHLSDHSLSVIMPHPTMGIVTPGLADWRGVDLDNVVEDIYNECLKTLKSGAITVFVGFENPQTDKYGNVTMAYEYFQIVTIPLEEAKKYKSGKFLDAEYQIKQTFYNAAFGQIQTYWKYQTTLTDGSKVYLAPRDPFQTESTQSAGSYYADPNVLQLDSTEIIYLDKYDY